MARRVAVSIGVARSAGLVSLPGALAGADEFTSWARGAGFDVVEINDRTNPVRAHVIYDAVRQAVEGRDVARRGHRASLAQRSTTSIDASQLVWLTDALLSKEVQREAGCSFSQKEVREIMGKNAIRILANALRPKS